MPLSNALKLRILIVDDQDVMRKIIRRLLKQVGFEQIEEATNGREALDHIRVTLEKPDVILSDLIMDEMSGLEFLNDVRREKNPAIRNIPIIILTGETDKLMLDVTRQVGAASILNKPVSATELLQAIEVAVGYVLKNDGPVNGPQIPPSPSEISKSHDI